MFFELFVSSRCAFDCFFACKGSNFFVMLYKIYCFFNVNVYDIHYFIITQIFIKHRDTKSQRKKTKFLCAPVSLCLYKSVLSRLLALAAVDASLHLVNVCVDDGYSYYVYNLAH